MNFIEGARRWIGARPVTWRSIAPDRLREVSAAVQTAPEPGDLPRAAGHSIRWIRVGCTVCHEGMGQSVSFRDASHMPGGRTTRSGTPSRVKWEEEFDWEEPHLWDYPMLPAKMTEASCAKCHKQEVFIPKADKLNVAYATYERAGCYACHKTRGFEGLQEAWPDPHEDQLEAHARLGEDLDTQSASAVKADDVDAAHLVRSNSNSRRRRGAERSRDQRGGRIPVRERGAVRARGEEPGPRRREARRADRRSRSAASAVTRSTRRRASRRVRGRTFGQPLREHRQQDDLRVDLQLGARSEALQPDHLHAGLCA